MALIFNRALTQMFHETVVHKVLKSCRCIGGALRAHLVLKMALPAAEGNLPHVLLSDPDLTVSVPEVDLSEFFCRVESV